MTWTTWRRGNRWCGSRSATTPPRSASRLRWKYLLPLCRQLPDHLRRLEALAQRFVLLELLHHLRPAERVAPAQDAAAPRREADPQDQPHVHVAGVAHDLLLQAAR